MVKWILGDGKHFLNTIREINKDDFDRKSIPKKDFKLIEDKLKAMFEQNQEKAWDIFFTLKESNPPSMQTLDTITKIYNDSEKRGISREAIKDKLYHIWDFNGKGCMELGVTAAELSNVYEKGKDVFQACTSFDAQRCLQHGVKITEMSDLYLKDKEKFSMLTGYKSFERPFSSPASFPDVCYECGVTMKELSAIYDRDTTKDKAVFAALTRYMLYDRKLQGHHDALSLGNSYPEYKKMMLSEKELSAVRTRLKSEFDKIKDIQDPQKIDALKKFSEEKGYSYYVYKHDKHEHLTLDEAIKLGISELNALGEFNGVVRYVELDDIPKLGAEKLHILQQNDNTVLGTLAVELTIQAMKTSSDIESYSEYREHSKSQKDVTEGIAAYLATHRYNPNKENIIKVLSNITEPQKIDQKKATEITDRLFEQPFKFDWSNKKESLKNLVSHVKRCIEDGLGMHKDVIDAAKAIGDDMRKINDKLVSTENRRMKEARKSIGLEI